MHDRYTHTHDTSDRKRLWGIIFSNAFYSTDKQFAPGLYPTAAKDGICKDEDQGVQGDKEMYTMDDYQQYNNQKSSVQKRSRRRTFKPRQFDLDMLLEYIGLLGDEGVYHKDSKNTILIYSKQHSYHLSYDN